MSGWVQYGDTHIIEVPTIHQLALLFFLCKTIKMMLIRTGTTNLLRHTHTKWKLLAQLEHHQ